ncbi:MAG: peptidoglycan DD-metalloendopeptidase family protein [Bacillota bacterium]
MGFLKKIAVYLFEKVNITVIPSPTSSVKTFSMRRILPIVVIMAVVVSISTLSYLYNFYEQNYLGITQKLEELKGVRAENQQLKNELYALAQDTEELRRNLDQLQEYNEEIKGMIDVEDSDNQASAGDVDLKLYVSLSEDNPVIQSGLPIGGGEFSLIYQPSQEIINQARNNINMLKQELPGQEENLSDLEMSVREYNDLKAATPTLWPLADNGDAYISSNYGWRKDPFTGKQELHEGLDIGAWYNTPILATADGVVKFAGRNGGYGLLVVIEHGYGYETRYAHLNKILVEKGQKISRGDRIALSGNSGRSNGPHLHYEVRINNIPKNPRQFIRG